MKPFKWTINSFDFVSFNINSLRFIQIYWHGLLKCCFFIFTHQEKKQLIQKKIAFFLTDDFDIVAVFFNVNCFIENIEQSASKSPQRKNHQACGITIVMSLTQGIANCTQYTQLFSSPRAIVLSCIYDIENILKSWK